MNPNAYTVNVRQIEVDGKRLFEARVTELPDVVDFGETHEEAYQLAIDTIETTADILAEQNRIMPQPAVVEDLYSGRMTLRVPKSLHPRLARQADREGVSLNQYLVTVLAHGCGTSFENATNADGWQTPPKHNSQIKRSSKHLTVIQCNDLPLDGWRSTG